MPVVKLIRTKGLDIYHQLRLEEALLRASTANWCFVNDGSAQTAIVLGISGKVPELVHEEAAQKAGIRLIKRFTGGGTVIVDQDTIFTGLILNAQDLPVDCFPQPIMQWTAAFYHGVFTPFGRFSLQGQDYTLGQRKFAGNAQAITKQRFVHHTSFLWDFCDANMLTLKHPAKTPKYRLVVNTPLVDVNLCNYIGSLCVHKGFAFAMCIHQGRSHLEFLCKLKEHVRARHIIVDDICCRFKEMGFHTEEANVSDAEALLGKEYLKGNKILV